MQMQFQDKFLSISFLFHINHTCYLPPVWKSRPATEQCQDYTAVQRTTEYASCMDRQTMDNPETRWTQSRALAILLMFYDYVKKI
jgi:hypothetical protein